MIGINDENTPFYVFDSSNTGTVSVYEDRASVVFNFIFVAVELGRHTKIKITPSKISASDNLESLRIRDRGCRFPSESETMRFLSDYSFKGCVFECMLDRARQECGCTPWNYPHPPGE